MPKLLAERLKPYEHASTARPHTSTRQIRRRQGTPMTTRQSSPSVRQAPSVTMLKQVSELLQQVEELLKVADDQHEVIKEMATTIAHLQACAVETEELMYRFADESALLRLHLAQRDDMLASMYAQISLLEGRMQLAAEQLTRRTTADARVCLCCFETCRSDDTLCCSGRDRHHFCHACVNRVCGTIRRAPCKLPVDSIMCMHVEDCQGQIYDINCLSEGKRLLADFHLHACVPLVQREIDRATAGGARTQVRLSMMRADGSFRGLQCAQCGHGSCRITIDGEYFLL